MKEFTVSNLLKEKSGVSFLKRCSDCGKVLDGAVYRIDKGSFGDNPIDHFLEEFNFEERIGYFCSDCIRSDYLKGRIKG